MRYAHTLSGVSGTVGADALSQAARNLESALLEQDSQVVEEMLTAVEKEWNKTMAELQSFLTSQPETD